MPIRLLCVAGARPNFMKLAPLFREFAKSPDIVPILVHTGQHFDQRMSGQFFTELGLPEPKYQLAAGSGSHAQQTAEIMKRFEPVAEGERPDAVLVVGDVNSTVACALVAKKLGQTVVHVEAGLRSFDRSMPEEINRLATDAISDVFLVTEESAVQNLRREGVADGRIFFTGNLMIDSLRHHLEASRASDLLDRLEMRGRRYGLVTLHRPGNVDSPEPFEEILGVLEEISRELPLLFPVHPRTRKLLPAEFGRGGAIRLLEPLGYLDFLSLLAGAAVVLTDSGGVQEESTILQVRCLTLRDNTERPVTVEYGWNRLAGTTGKSIRRAWRELDEQPVRFGAPPMWDGQAAARCAAAIRQSLGG